MSSLKELLARKKAEAEKNAQAPTNQVESNPVHSQNLAEESKTQQLIPVQTQTEVSPSNISSELSSGNESAQERREANHPLVMEMAELQAALDSNVPGFATILKRIHEKLRADPAVVTLMSEEEIAVVVKGLSRHSQIEVVAPKAVKDAKKLARGTRIGADDL